MEAKGVATRVPQVVQTSAMDCGPAVLTSVLRGCGLSADLEGVRDLCATGLDGTSIDVLSDLAVAFGLRARQVVVPVDHLGAPAAGGLLPAVVVTELPGALLHFVVVWRRVGRWVEVMDPASGRRWVRLASLRRDLYRHEMSVATSAWRAYAGTEAFIAPLTANLRACGVSDSEADALVGAAVASPQAGPIARLDAVGRRAVRLGHDAAQVRRALQDAEWAELEPDSMVGVDPPSGSGVHGETAELVMRGAVVLTIDGVDADAEVPAEMARRVLVESPSAWAVLGGMLAASGMLRFCASVAALFVASVGSIAAAFLLEQLVADGTGEGSRSLVGVIGAVLAVVASLSVAGMAGVVAAGRCVEMELRERLDQRVGRLPDAFFRTRPSSDLAERAHAIHRLRDLSTSVAELSVAAGQVAAATVGLLVVAPASWWAVVLLVPAVVVPSLVSVPVLVEREHRSRAIAGALSHVYLDSLLGALPVRAHRADAAIESEHGELLDSWAAAERSRHRLGAAAITATLVAGYGVAALVVATVASTAQPSEVVLVAFLAFVAVNAGVVLVNTLRRLAPEWIVAQRLLALSTVELDPPPVQGGPARAVEIELRSVCVDGDHGPLLDDVSLRIRPGEHLGIVGPSGAGKSTLVAVLLGWVSPDRGQVLVDGVELTPERAAALRARCGWVDPDVLLWAGTLADNLRAAPRWAPPGWSSWAPRIGLDAVAARLGGPRGQVGDAGKLLSGGEAQRVRLGRLFMRPDAPLVVLDEATRGLDPAVRASTLDAIRDQFASATTISVTHDLDEAISMPRVLYLDGGRVLADGAPARLLESPDDEFTKLIIADAELRASLGPENGWMVARLDSGRLTVDAAPVPQPPSVQHPSSRPTHAGSEPDGEPDCAERTHRRGTVLASVVAATVVVALEWTLYLRGWSAMLAETRSSLWPLWFTGAAVAAGLSTWLLAAAAVQVGTRLRQHLLDGGMRLDLDLLRRRGSGDLNGRVLEAEMFEQQAVAGGTDTLFGVAQLVGAVAVVVLAGGPPATAAAVLAWLAALVVVAAVATRVRHDWTSERINRTRLLLERFRGHRTETVYGPPPHATPEHLDDYRARSRRSDAAKTVLLANANLWIFAGVAVTVATATDDSMLGGLAAVLLGWSAFGVLGVAFDDLVTAATASRQLRPLLPAESRLPRHLTPAVSSSADADTPGITEVTYTYNAATPPLLDDVNFTLRLGDRVVLHGDSGSGKSTLGTVLAGIRAPTSGTAHRADKVVYVAQFGDNHTFQSSLAFNVLMGHAWPPDTQGLDHADELLTELGLRDLLRRMPRGLAQPVGDAGWQLSHGERGRLYLARALAQHPEVVVLDESLEGLDPRTVQAAIATTARRVPSLIVISHR